jgi:hypothetical protein
MGWSSEARELFPVLLAYLLDPEAMRGAFVVHTLDNACAALAIDYGRAGSHTEHELLASLYACADDLGVEFIAWWNSRRLNKGPDDLSKCPSPADARRWAEKRGLDLTIWEEDASIPKYLPGSLRR